jgi:hypothetical protein
MGARDDLQARVRRACLLHDLPCFERFGDGDEEPLRHIQVSDGEDCWIRGVADDHFGTIAQGCIDGCLALLENQDGTPGCRKVTSEP